MGELGWGLLMLGALVILCIVIIVIACFHAVWLIRLVYCMLTRQAIPAPPFSKSRRDD